MAQPRRQLADLRAEEFAGVDPLLFEEWGSAAVLARRRTRNAWIVYGVIAAGLLVTGIGALLPGPPLLLTLFFINRRANRMAKQLGIAQAVPLALKKPLDPETARERSEQGEERRLVRRATLWAWLGWPLCVWGGGLSAIAAIGAVSDPRSWPPEAFLGLAVIGVLPLAIGILLLRKRHSVLAEAAGLRALKTAHAGGTT